MTEPTSFTDTSDDRVQETPSSLARYLQWHTLPEAGYTPANLYALRQQHGLSEADVAKLLGVQERTVINWEQRSTVFRNMPYQSWKRLVAYVNQQQPNSNPKDAD